MSLLLLFIRSWFLLLLFRFFVSRFDLHSEGWQKLFNQRKRREEEKERQADVRKAKASEPSVTLL